MTDFKEVLYLSIVYYKEYKNNPMKRDIMWWLKGVLSMGAAALWSQGVSPSRYVSVLANQESARIPLFISIHPGFLT
jgi:hypothetical protein